MKRGIDFIGVGCGAHIINENNQILLIKRNKNCRNKANHWSIPGGGINFFEKIDEALKREIKEELGIDIQIIQLISITDDIIKEENQHWISPQFLCKIIKGTPINLEPHKCEEIRWFDLDKIPENITNTTKDGLNFIRKIN
ncbi:NUDIX domain-containing protein [archaeon]|jgi:8-oxo-dGTP diphosphatase|nr:NUDIX domain-containing protein [archaeon]MBT5287504.1 NUDIX domain-containing protein [archaeon]